MQKNIAFTWLIIVLTTLAGCAVSPRHPSLQNADTLTSLLPVRAFVANLDSNGGYTISPDGKKIAWIGVKGLGPALLVKTIGRDEVTAFKGMPIGFKWAQDSHRLFYLKDEGGNENFHVLMVDSTQPDVAPVDLTPIPGIAAMIHRVIQSDPAHILVLHNQRDKKVFDLYKINIDTREQTRVAENPGDAIGVTTNHEGNLIAVIRQSGDRTRLEAKRSGSDTPQEIISWDSEATVRVLDAAPDGRSLYLLSNRQGDRIGLTRLDMQSGQETLLAEDPDVDLSDALISNISYQPLIAYSDPSYPRVQVLDVALRRSLDSLFAPAPKALHVLSMDDSEKKMTLRVDDDANSKFYLFDRDTNTKTLIGIAPNSHHSDQLSSPKPITLQSRDGEPLHGYLTLPKGASVQKLPMVLLVHGGPWGRDMWSNGMGTEQFLANRGYAVLQINYRGSTGYGRQFTEAGIGELGGNGKMHTDLIDGVQWAISQGIADPDKIAIMGGSFGGYATLVGLTFTPAVFACGVDLVGPSNLAELLENAPEYWKPFMSKWHRYLGDPTIPEQRKKMLEQSPVSHADAVRSPLLIVQGANDPRVKQNQSDQMVRALRQAGKQVDYLLLSDEGHGTRNWQNRLKEFRRTEDFLAGCLGGSSSGFDLFELAAWMF